MKNGHQYLIFSLSFPFLFLFSNQVLAATFAGGHAHTDCPSCQKLANDYNKIADEQTNAEQTLSDIRNSIRVDNELIQKDQARIAELGSLPPSPKKASDLQTANKALDNDEADLKKHQQDESSQIKIVFNLIDQKSALATALDDCEEWHCDAYSTAYTRYSAYSNYTEANVLGTYLQAYAQLAQVQLGLMVGNMPAYRRFHLMDLDDSADANHTRDSADVGLQLKLLFGNADSIKPTLTVNMDKRLNASNTIWDLRLNNDWTTRGLVGVESPTFFTHFTAGVGAGVAVFDQSISSMIGGFHIANSNMSAGPSLGANLSYQPCSQCLFGQGLTISGQVAADRYENISADNGMVSASVDQKWQLSENLVFSIDLGHP